MLKLVPFVAPTDATKRVFFARADHLDQGIETAQPGTRLRTLLWWFALGHFLPDEALSVGIATGGLGEPLLECGFLNLGHALC